MLEVESLRRRVRLQSTLLLEHIPNGDPSYAYITPPSLAYAVVTARYKIQSCVVSNYPSFYLLFSLWSMTLVISS